MGLPTICWSHAGSPEERLGMRLKSVGKIQLLSWADAEDLRLTDVYRYMQAEELGGGGAEGNISKIITMLGGPPSASPPPPPTFLKQ